jgi:hypothetical protein
MRVGIEGDELVADVMTEVRMAHRSMGHFAGARQIVDHILPVKTFLHPGLYDDGAVFSVHESSGRNAAA